MIVLFLSKKVKKIKKPLKREAGKEGIKISFVKRQLLS